MEEKVYNKLMRVCDELETLAVSYLSDVCITDIYNERYYDNKEIYGILLQLCTISRFKETLMRLKTYDVITKGMKEGETE